MFSEFTNLLLQSDKVALDIQAKIMDVYDSSNLNRFTQYEGIVVSYAHVVRDASNTK